ncbi:MAG: carboxypeptidase-like regulatory domain-containing protein, partial [Muribaculaceae bacterium]|nr:carboxypeptidase-like regulatory domain-containing protein [Muribaculaceae bacterium]
MRRLLTLMAVLTAFVTSAFAARTASGYVYSVSDDQPVIGASVMAKGTTLGTATDIDGNFVLK